MLKYAFRELELLPRNPWEGLDISFKTTNKRRPWTDEELTKFFAQPLHTEYKLPKDKKAGADAAYWIPLLGLYTGARVSELAQLQVCDVVTEKGVNLLSITDEGENQSVKTDAGVRKVPIHGELVRLGFLDYVESIKARKEALLWPLLATREGKAGGYFSHWFGQYRRSPAVGFGLKPDFHCLRHTVRTLLADQDVSEQDMDALIGHEVKGSTGARVYRHDRLKQLQKAVNALHYPTLTLHRIYPDCAP